MDRGRPLARRLFMTLRTDRLATLYFFHPWKRLAGTRPGVPILMYHSIFDGRGDSRHPYFQTWTSPLRFAEHMAWLHGEDYRTISLAALARRKESDFAGHGKEVVLTFDDGFQDFYTEAVPVLMKYGFSATMGLPTAFIGHRRRQFWGRDCLIWEEVRELRGLGIDFASHTVNHRQLCGMTREEVCRELVDSKQTIETELGMRVDGFAYPYAFPEGNRWFVDWFSEALAASGYCAGVCTAIGVAHPNSNRLAMPRIPVNDWDDTLLLQAKLEGAYDWLHPLQYLAKHIRSSRSIGRGESLSHHA